MPTTETWINAGPIDGAYVVRRSDLNELDDVAFVPVTDSGEIAALGRADRIAAVPTMERDIVSLRAALVAAGVA